MEKKEGSIVIKPATDLKTILKRLNRIKLMRYMIAALFLIAVIFAAGCASQPQDKETIKIGVIAPLSGSLADLGTSVHDAIELSKEHNSIQGKTIDVIYEDDKSCNSGEAVTAANKLISIDKVSAIITVCSSSTLSIVPLAESSNTTILSAVATTPLLTNRSMLAFRIASSSTQWANKAAQIARSLNFTSAAIIYEQNDYPVGWKNSFNAAFELYGGNVVAEESYSTGESDFRTIIAKIKQKKPDILLIIPLSPLTGSNIVKQLREMLAGFQILGSEILSFRAFLNNSAGYSDGIYVITYEYDPSSPKMSKFLDDYQKEFRKNITEGIYGAMGYDAFALVAKGTENCSNSGKECIRSYLTNNLNKNITGISGLFYIDENHDGSRGYQVRVIENNNLGRVIG